MDVETYVAKVVAGELRDATLTMQLDNGFEVRGVIHDYMPHHHGEDYASLIVWENPDYSGGLSACSCTTSWRRRTPTRQALAFGGRRWTFGRAGRRGRTGGGRPGRPDRTGRPGGPARSQPPGLRRALYGIPAAGRIAVPLNQRLAPAEIAAQVERVGRQPGHR